MMTDRQLALLDAIIREYLDTSEPVGSTVVVKKYDFNCSAATVRNEMAKLLDEGLLDMLHTSSGRVPTAQAYRVFLSEIMEEEEVPVLQEVAIKQRLWPARYDINRLLRQAVISLADITHLLSFATTEDGYVVNSGAVNLLDNSEFWDIDTAKAALLLVDRTELLNNALSAARHNAREVSTVIGSELGNEHLTNASIVFSQYQVGKNEGYFGVLGPSRMDYERVIPSVRYMKNLVQELAGSW